MSNSNKMIAKTEKSRNGMPNLILNGIPLHSTYDPVKEALKTCNEIIRQNPKMIIVFENGFGYLPLQLAERFPDTDIIVIIPAPEIYSDPLLKINSFPKDLPAHIHVLSPFTESAFSALIAGCRTDQIVFLVNPSLEKLFPDIISTARKLLSYHRQIEETNAATLKKYGKRFEHNIRYNTRHLSDGETCLLNKLKGKINTKPLIIIGAGPTLDRHINELVTKRNHYLILSVDTAACILQKQGIQPDWVITGDPQFFNAMHLFFFNSRKTFLIAPLSTYYLNTRKRWKNIFFYASRFPSEKRIADEKKIVLLGSGGTVAATAVEAARYMGAQTIYLLGIDLGYPCGQTHAKGSFFETKVEASASRLIPIETDSYKILHSSLQTETTDYTGRRILSDKRMDLYRIWFERYARECIRIDQLGSCVESLPVINSLPE